MRLLCRLRGHRASAPEVFNEGLYFSTCAGCGGDIIRQRGGRWYLVPHGFRVTWRAEGEHRLTPWKAIKLAHDQRRG